jgi:hypothetical protein
MLVTPLKENQPAGLLGEGREGEKIKAEARR